jgi:hypothetical protein
VQKITWVIRDRSEGKTSALIKWLLPTDAIAATGELYEQERDHA